MRIMFAFIKASQPGFQRFVSVLLLGLLLTACEEEAAPPVEVVRSVKTMVLATRAGEQTRKIAGITEAATVTDLAFETAGRILEIRVDIGDTLNKGDVVASLDAEPYRLRIRSAEGQLSEAQARLSDAEAKFEQQNTLYKKGFATKTAYDTALANLNTSRSAVEVATSQLRLAERDLQLTTLKAPLSGRLTEKYVERFYEITAGQKIVQLSADGDLKVKASVPEGLIAQLNVGDKITAQFPTLDGKQLPGTITQVASRAGTTNSFPIIAVLDENDPAVLPGLTVEVVMSFKTDATGKAFLVPVTAVLPAPEPRVGSIFVFDKTAGTIEERKIKVVNVRGNELEISGDIAEGDIIAVAGVSFLVDGMKVKLLDPSQAG